MNEKSISPSSRRPYLRGSSLGLAAIACLLLGCSGGGGGGGSSNGGEGGEGDEGGSGGSASGGKGGSASGGSGGSASGGKGGSASGGSGGSSSGGSGGSASGGSGGSSGGSGGSASGGSGGSASGGSGGSSSGGAGGSSSKDGGVDSGGGAAGSGGTDPSAYKVFVGQSHAHSTLSHKSHSFPGTDSPAVGFMKAKANGAQFYWITDHVDSGPISPADFDTVQKAADAATDATFVGLASIEFHLTKNEANPYGIKLDSNHISQANKLTALQYAAFLKKTYPGSFMQWTHPNRDPHPLTGRTPELDETIALLEILNDLYGDTADDDYNKALDNGWHIGPSAGHDNHGEIWWDFAKMEKPFIMGVLATSLTKDNILDGMRQSRTFASFDTKMRVWYDINGAIMGETTPMAATYKATVKIEGTTATKIDIITKGGKVLTSGTPTAGVWTADLPGVVAGTYYYALITSGPGKTWTAPVWVQ